MNDVLTMILLFVSALALSLIIGYELGKRRGIARARDDMELRKVEAEWMREQRDFLEALK